MSGEILNNLWEQSVTPVENFTGLICMAKNWVFKSNRNVFPKVTFTLDGIWRHMGALFCNWKWIKWFRRLFNLFKKNKFMGDIDQCPSDFFAFTGAGVIEPLSWHALYFSRSQRSKFKMSQFFVFRYYFTEFDLECSILV
jgi:hypothetical protein